MDFEQFIVEGNPIKYDYDESLIVVDLKKGLSHKEIAKKHKITKAVVRSIVVKYPTTKRQARFDHKYDYDEDIILQDLIKGLPHKEIAKKHKITVGVVKSVCKKYPDQTKRVGQYDIPKILKDLEKGMLHREIAKKYKISKNIVKNIAVKYPELRRTKKTSRKTSQIKSEKLSSRFDKKFIHKVLDDYYLGLGTKELAQKYNLLITDVRTIVSTRMKEIPVGRVSATRLKLSDKKIVEIIASYESGESMLAVGKKFNYSATTIRAILLRNAIKIRVWGARPIPLDTKEIVRRYKNRESISKIADKFGVSYTTIRHRLFEAGIDIAYHPEARKNPTTTNNLLFKTPLSVSKYLLDNYWLAENQQPNHIKEYENGLHRLWDLYEDNTEEHNIAYKKIFQKSLKKYFNQKVISYRGFSFGLESLDEDYKEFQKYDFVKDPKEIQEFINQKISFEVMKDSSHHSLNVVTSAHDFTGIYHKAKAPYGFLFVYEAPLSKYKEWGGDTESWEGNEFEIIASGEAAHFIKEVYMVTNKPNIPFKKTSKKDLDKYSLDKAYSPKGEANIGYLHKNADVQDYSLAKKRYKLKNLPNNYEWYTLFKK